MLSTLHENMCIGFAGMFMSNLCRGSTTAASGAPFCRLVCDQLIPGVSMILIRTDLVALLRDEESKMAFDVWIGTNIVVCL